MTADIKAIKSKILKAISVYSADYENEMTKEIELAIREGSITIEFKSVNAENRNAISDKIITALDTHALDYEDYQMDDISQMIRSGQVVVCMKGAYVVNGCSYLPPMSIEELIDENIISWTGVRNYLVRKRFSELSDSGQYKTNNQLIRIVASEFCVTTGSVRGIVKRRYEKKNDYSLFDKILGEIYGK